MLENVLLEDFLAVASRIPHPDLIKEDTMVLHFTDSSVVQYMLGAGERFEAVGTLHKVTLKKSWSTKGKVWVFA